MGLRDTYAYAIQTAKGKFQGNAEERDGKLHFKGTVSTEEEKNEIWNAIKTIPTWQKDIVADIQVTGGPAAAPRAPVAAPAPPAARTYTVKAGDTLSAIAKISTRQRRVVYEDLRVEQGPAERSRQDQARAGSAFALTPRQAPPGWLLPPTRFDRIHIWLTPLPEWRILRHLLSFQLTYSSKES